MHSQIKPTDDLVTYLTVRHIYGSKKATFTIERKKRHSPGRENEPSKETIVAMREAERIAKNPSAETYSDMDALFENLQE